MSARKQIQSTYVYRWRQRPLITIIFITEETDMKNKIETGIDGLEEYIFDEIETDQKISDFVDYVHQFYGKDGIYAKQFFPPNGATPAEIVLAVKIKLLMNIDLPFDGDSMDREIVRDIMAQARLAQIILNKKRGE